MKKFLLAACLILVLVTAMALPAMAESEKEALSYEELMSFVNPYIDRAKASTPLNAPIDETALGEDGYTYIYDFATMYFDKPTLDEDTKLNAMVIYSEEEAILRDVGVDSGFEKLLAAFYSENNELSGSRDFAYLYVSDTMPMGAMWARVQRAGQSPMTVQYAIHEQLPSGGDGYTDCGLIYTIQANTIVAVRAYGLSNVIDEAQVNENLRGIDALAKDTSYFMHKRSATGNDVEAFTRDDLSFAGLDFLSVTPEECLALLGEAMEDVWMEDDDAGFFRNINYEDSAFTFVYDSEKQNPQLIFLEIFAYGIEGPRGIAIGETLSDVMQRFMHSQVPYDGGTLEVLYGAEGEAQYATAEYWEGGECVLRYLTDVGMDAPVTLQMYFDTDGLNRIMLYHSAV